MIIAKEPVVSTNLTQRSARPAAMRNPAPVQAPRSLLADVRELPAWAVSLAIHVALLLVLAGITRIEELPRSMEITTTVAEDMHPEDYEFEVMPVEDQVGNQSNVNTPSLSLASAQQPGRTAQRQMPERLDEELLTVEVPVADQMLLPEEADLVEAVRTAGANEHPGGVEGALDRLTYEIAGSLKERKTLAIWLFDASQSQKAQREAIAERFENVYRQLGQLDVGAEKSLKTAVVSFAKEVRFLTEQPVEDYREVVDAVRSIEADPSTGLENTLTAVMQAAQRWQHYRTRKRRNVMMIVVTDERGDDYAKLERVIQQLRRFGIRVYCVGSAAPFGRVKGHIDFRAEDGYLWKNQPIDQGPESAAPERLQLAFWGSSAGDLQQMSSGFGPYTLSRLCAETGGLFLVTAQPPGPRFDPGVMRSYAPDYCSIREYQMELNRNRAKAALVQAARSTRVEKVPTPRLRFRADNENILRRQITEAQKPLARLDYHLSEMMRILNEGEKDRPELTDPRWRAGFDLAMGRVLAMRVRAYGYNAVLAEMKVSPKPFEKDDSNMWRLVPSETITAGPQVERIGEKAVKYLRRVIDEHPGTPWALLAERELEQPLGWKWTEGHMDIPEPSGPGERPAGPLLVEEQTPDQNPSKDDKPKRTPPNL